MSDVSTKARELGAVQGRLGAYLNTIVADLKIEGKGQYLRDLFAPFENDLAIALLEAQVEQTKLCKNLSKSYDDDTLGEQFDATLAQLEKELLEARK